MSENSPIYKHTGIIRSLRVPMGEHGTMILVVGKPIPSSGVIVSRISQDLHDNEIFGIKRYNVFIYKTEDAEKVELLWKSYDNMPCIVEYDINHSPHLNA